AAAACRRGPCRRSRRLRRQRGEARPSARGLGRRRRDGRGTRRATTDVCVTRRADARCAWRARGQPRGRGRLSPHGRLDRGAARPDPGPAARLMRGLVLAIFGPTASGKSAVAEAIAARIPADLVSADSTQVYRGLPLLTNQSDYPTQLVAIWDLDHEASVAEYQ